MIHDRRPTVAEIIAELDNPTAEIGFCRKVCDGRFHSWVEPAELYIEALNTWLRADGSYGSFALNGHRHYGRNSRRELRRAVDRWIIRRAHGPSLDDILKALNGMQEPKGWDGSFNESIGLAMILLMNMERRYRNDPHHAKPQNMGHRSGLRYPIDRRVCVYP